MTTMHLGRLIEKDKNEIKKAKRFNISLRMLDLNIPRGRLYRTFNLERPTVYDLAVAGVILKKDYTIYLESENDKNLYHSFQKQILQKVGKNNNFSDPDSPNYGDELGKMKILEEELKYLKKEAEAKDNEITMLHQLLETKDKYIKLLEEKKQSHD
jgi:hypothetical protein